MNIGIIVYSGTGNTLSVAQKLEEKLRADGHTVALEQVKVSGWTRQEPTRFTLTATPEVDSYDAVVFASSVLAFNLVPPMARYLEQIGPLDGKPVALLITKHLPLYITGGRQAVGKMTKLCKSKGGQVLGSGYVIWSSPRRQEMIAEAVEKVGGLL